MQACADDPQVAFHAVRQLARLAYGAAQMRWAQTGFLAECAGRRDAAQPDGLQGRHQQSAAQRDAADGRRSAQLDEVVWVGEEGPAWMRGGSYLVARRIRISLEHWDRSEVDFQEQVIGRHKYSGAPIGKTGELDPLDLDAPTRTAIR